VHAGAPPFLILHGSRDSLVPVADAHVFVEALRGVSRQPVLYGEMVGGQHAFDVIPSWRTAPVIEAIERFLTTIYAQQKQTQHRPVPSLRDELADALTD
jgi:acetyl esterase/lipase